MRISYELNLKTSGLNEEHREISESLTWDYNRWITRKIHRREKFGWNINHRNFSYATQDFLQQYVWENNSQIIQEIYASHSKTLTPAKNGGNVGTIIQCRKYRNIVLWIIINSSLLCSFFASNDSTTPYDLFEFIFKTYAEKRRRKSRLTGEEIWRPTEHCTLPSASGIR